MSKSIASRLTQNRAVRTAMAVVIVGAIAIGGSQAHPAPAHALGGSLRPEPNCEAPYTASGKTIQGPVKPLEFGAYPGGYAGGGTDDYLPNDPAQIEDAISELQGPNPTFIVRAYKHFNGAGEELRDDPEDFAQYVHSGRKLDLVLEYTAANDDMAGWRRFIKQAIDTYGTSIASLTVSLEANLENTALGRKALVQGVIAAKTMTLIAGKPQIRVGFSVINFGAPFDDQFWKDLKSEGGLPLALAVDYVGVDLYAGQLGGVEPEYLGEVTTESLRMTKNCSMATAGLLSTTRLRVTENGFPTFTGRTEQDQALALELTIRAVAQLREELRIDSYELFSLRDANSTEEGLFNQLGIMRDDYTPKLAFETVRSLFASCRNGC
ncbi:hypothetical protein [Microbacterium sp.]|uniref:hypothetical protein n=1 Tax=Microbacterium sp. TaxID=51671 RepID=UPI003F97035E